MIAPPRFHFTRLSHHEFQAYLNASQDDPLLTAKLEFLTRWAGLLETKIRVHEEALKTSAATTALEANPELIDGVMLDQVVEMMTKVWIHGDKLAKWYKGPDGQELRKIIGTHHRPASGGAVDVPAQPTPESGT